MDLGLSFQIYLPIFSIIAIFRHINFQAILCSIRLYTYINQNQYTQKHLQIVSQMSSEHTFQQKFYKFMNEMDFKSQDNALILMRAVLILTALVFLIITQDFLWNCILLSKIQYMCVQHPGSYGFFSNHNYARRMAMVEAASKRICKAEKIMIISKFATYQYFQYAISIEFIQLMISKASRRMINLTTHMVYANSTSDVEYHKDLPLPKLILNKPKVLNSMNLEMIRHINAQIPQIKESKAFWMEGAGGKAFCAGGDVKSLYEETSTYEDRETFFREQFITDYEMASLQSLQIANWDGIVMGGGIGISINAPFRIATEKTMLAMPESKIGFFTDVGSCYFLSKMRSNIGMYIALTAGRLKGEDVYNSGFANYFVARQSIPKIYEEIANQISTNQNPKEMIDQVITKYNIGNQGKKIEHEDEINHIFGGQSVAEVYERAKNTKNAFGESVVKALDEVCPLSLHVIFKLIRTVGNMPLRECFIRDFRVAQQFSSGQNFKEGVRALLITKTNDPKWTHKSLAEVSEEEVARVFSDQGRKPLPI